MLGVSIIRFSFWLTAAAIVVVCQGSALLAQQLDSTDVLNREYDLKAVFLYKFGRYVQWPDGSPGKADEAFIIGIIGADPFGKALDYIAATQRIEGNKIVIYRWRDVSEIRPCHILFLPRTLDARTQRAAIEATANRHVLVVGETPGFCQQGGVINFFIAENNVRFEISLKAAQRQQLTISSSLLKLARLVDQ